MGEEGIRSTDEVSNTVNAFSTTTASTVAEHIDSDIEIIVPEKDAKLSRKKRRAEKQKKRKREQKEKEEENASGVVYDIDVDNDEGHEEEHVKKKRKTEKKKKSSKNKKQQQLLLPGTTSDASANEGSLGIHSSQTQQQQQQQRETKQNKKKKKNDGNAVNKSKTQTLGFEDRKGDASAIDNGKKKPQRLFPYGNFNKYYNVRDAQRIGKMARVFIMEDHFALLASNALGEPYTQRPNLAQLIEENSVSTTDRNANVKNTHGGENNSSSISGNSSNSVAWQDLCQQSALIEKFMKNKKMMDIGCNAGIFTIQMAKYLRLSAVLGVDIDSGLIRRAWKLRNGYISAKTRDDFLSKFEKQRAGEFNTGVAAEEGSESSKDRNTSNISAPTSSGDSSGNISEEIVVESLRVPNSIDQMDEDDDDDDVEIIRETDNEGRDENTVAIATSPDSKEYDDIVSAAAKQLDNHTGRYKFAIKGADRFPENVRFSTFNYVCLTRTLNDMQKDILKTKFDIVTCFSVTKWIHLNFGDRGIERLFRQVYDNLTKDGVFVLEMQNFRSYRKRRTMTKRISAIYPTIKTRPNDFPKMLIDKIGFACYESRIVSREQEVFKHFNRPIYFFYKQKPPGFDERAAAEVKSNESKATTTTTASRL